MLVSFAPYAPLAVALSFALSLVACGGEVDAPNTNPERASGGSTPTGNGPDTSFPGAPTPGPTPIPKHGIPSGTFTRCARGTLADDSSFNASGIEPGLFLTVAKNGTSVTATVNEADGKQSSFELATASDDSASLVSASTVLTRAMSSCVISLGNVAHSPTELTVSSATLTHDGNTVFLWAKGISSDVDTTAACGSHSVPSEYWLVCDEGDARTGVSSNTAEATPSSFPTGDYACTSQIGTYQDGATKGYGTSGMKGTLTLALTPTEEGTDITATYAGDKFIRGSMKLTPTSASSARALPKQSLTASCDVGSAGTPPSNAPETLDLDASSLVVDGTTLFFSLSGTIGSGACPGATKMATLICTKQ